MSLSIEDTHKRTTIIGIGVIAVANHHLRVAKVNICGHLCVCERIEILHDSF